MLFVINGIPTECIIVFDCSLLSERPDDVECGCGFAGVVDEEVGRGGAQTEEPELAPLGVRRAREVGYRRQVRHLEELLYSCFMLIKF